MEHSTYCCVLCRRESGGIVGEGYSDRVRMGKGQTILFEKYMDGEEVVY